MSLPLTQPQRFMAEAFLKTWKDMKEQVEKIEAELVSQVHLVGPWAAVVERLQTIPGVGLLTALLLFLELWDMERFPSPKKLAAYVGLVPGVYQTGQTHHGTSITKQGNTYVRWVLVQGAWSAVRWDARYRGMFEHYRIHHIPTRAIIPIARQILIDVYEVWKDGISYTELLERKKKRIA